MKNKRDETSEGLNQLIEIINAKGDIGELKEIVENKSLHPKAEKDHELEK